MNCLIDCSKFGVQRSMGCGRIDESFNWGIEGLLEVRSSRFEVQSSGLCYGRIVEVVN